MKFTTKYGAQVLSLIVATTVVACSTDGPDPTNVDPSPGCATDPSACEPTGPAPTLAELQDAYVDSLHSIIDSGDLVRALAWIQAQERVAEAEADDHGLFFRLDGGEPVFMIDIEADTPGAVAPPSLWRAGERTLPTGAGVPAGVVVGKGTNRDHHQNIKRAMFLEPYEWQFGVRFQNQVAELRTIPDYAHSADDVWHGLNGDVDPLVFAEFDLVDAVFVTTHGGQFTGGTWVSTGVLKQYQAGNYGTTCAEIMRPYDTIPGTSCGHISVGPNRFAAVGLLAEFFEKTYGQTGGLQRAIVYMGGCKTLLANNWDLADALAGVSSAYFGWDDTVFGPAHTTAIDGLLYMLISRRATTQTALDVVCLAGQCGGGGAAALILYDNGAEPKKLRLYDPPTLKDPQNPATILGLAPGDTVFIRGVPADGRLDSLPIVVDVTGVIDPDDTSGGPVGVSQVSDPATLYNIGFSLDGAPLGFDNLGAPTLNAVVTQLDETTWRYAYAPELPFDLPAAGRSATLRAEIPLPEGGLGDYEVDVVLMGQGCWFEVKVGSTTYEARRGDVARFRLLDGPPYNGGLFDAHVYRTGDLDYPSYEKWAGVQVGQNTGSPVPYDIGGGGNFGLLPGESYFLSHPGEPGLPAALVTMIEQELTDEGLRGRASGEVLAVTVGPPLTTRRVAYDLSFRVVLPDNYVPNQVTPSIREFLCTVGEVGGG